MLVFLCCCLFCCVVKVILFWAMTPQLFQARIQSRKCYYVLQVVTNQKIYFDESQDLMSCCRKHHSLNTFYSNSMSFSRFAVSKPILDVSKMVRQIEPKTVSWILPTPLGTLVSKDPLSPLSSLPKGAHLWQSVYNHSVVARPQSDPYFNSRIYPRVITMVIKVQMKTRLFVKAR